jgi:hypothetical protein
MYFEAFRSVSDATAKNSQKTANDRHMVKPRKTVEL